MWGIASRRLIPVVFAIALANQVQAAEIVQVSEIGLGQEAFPEFEQFDPSLGTLHEIAISFSYAFTVQVGFENLANVPRVISGYGNPLGLFILQDPNFVVGYSEAMGVGYDWFEEPVAAFDGTIDFAGAAGRSSPLIQQADGLSFQLPAEEVEFFIGTSPLIVLHTINSDLQFSEHMFGGGAQDIAQYFSATGTSTLTLTYAYTPVPEPATSGLLFTLLIGLISRTRRA